MKINSPSDGDPIAANMRKARARRRIGEGRSCTCGEDRPETFIAGDKVVCAECQRKASGKSAHDHHHVAGKSNDSTTIPVPTNDHQAVLSVKQMDWPRKTLENPNGSPLLRASAGIRGFMDTLRYLIEKILGWIPPILEQLDAFLEERFDPQWWSNTPLAMFVPGMTGARPTADCR